MITIRPVRSEADVQAILDLQRTNLRGNVPVEQYASEGFVTIQHNFDLLRRMSEAMPSIIATDEHSTLIGYALTMLPSFAEEIPGLNDLFDAIRQIDYEGKPLRDYSYYVMGQSCVAHGFRGQKVLARMLEKHRELYQDRYRILITSIAAENPRSLAAHVRAGFKIIQSLSNDTWHLLLWDWNK